MVSVPACVHICAMCMCVVLLMLWIQMCVLLPSYWVLDTVSFFSIKIPVTSQKCSFQDPFLLGSVCTNIPVGLIACVKLIRFPSQGECLTCAKWGNP